MVATEWGNTESRPMLWTDEYGLWRAVVANKSRSKGKWDLAPNRGQFALDNAHLISNSDLDQNRWLCRKLYHDTGGRRAIVVVTMESV